MKKHRNNQPKGQHSFNTIRKEKPDQSKNKQHLPHEEEQMPQKNHHPSKNTWTHNAKQNWHQTIHHHTIEFSKNTHPP
ncbi:hypothetical protein, partial [Gordonia sp. NPDC003585]|uniref:hypothetical protein n=1 Tax=Gordonia sp. NPDC003585 TaxID=3154275 RepID=UPI0033B0AD48